ncbi:MAG: response regulator transcription factor [Chitinophagaceae bacterium]|nr:response regulator transcription factor [Chitinophagaceae bacterium]MDP1762509.1 response regulator transcription factor [Sediminibacterium sp.]
MIQVAMVDDHILLRQGLASVINSFAGYKVIYEANNGKQFTEWLNPANLPDLVLMDINMPEMNGHETALWLHTHYPQVKFIALSMMNDERSIIKMLQNGARGYLLKDAEIEDLKKALHDVTHKGIYINHILYKHIVDSIHGIPAEEETEQEKLKAMSEREKEFLRWLCTDKSYKEIAAAMYLSPRTIDGYRDALFTKLKVVSRIGLVLFAIRNEIAKV